MQGKASVSRSCYAKAYRLFVRLQDQFGQAYSMCGQGNSYRMNRNYQKALPFMTQAIHEYKKIGQKGPRGFVLWSRSQAFLGFKMFSRAQKDLSQSDLLFKSVNDQRGLTYVALGWGEFYRSQEKLEIAQSYFKKAFILAKKIS
jgi:tetratricopeptide (TPR) repeat protein